ASLQKKHQSLCLLLLEVDEFQKMAKEIGEEGEKKLLSHLQQMLKLEQRPLDMVLPQGNGRFLMILPNTSHRAAMAIAETVPNDIHKKPFQLKSRQFSLTLSIGVVALDKNSVFSQSTYDQFGTMLEKVDKALGVAKQKGNKIVSE